MNEVTLLRTAASWVAAVSIVGASVAGCSTAGGPPPGPAPTASPLVGAKDPQNSGGNTRSVGCDNYDDKNDARTKVTVRIDEELARSTDFCYNFPGSAEIDGAGGFQALTTEIHTGNNTVQWKNGDDFTGPSSDTAIAPHTDFTFPAHPKGVGVTGVQLFDPNQAGAPKIATK